MYNSLLPQVHLVYNTWINLDFPVPIKFIAFSRFGSTLYYTVQYIGRIVGTVASAAFTVFCCPHFNLHFFLPNASSCSPLCLTLFRWCPMRLVLSLLLALTIRRRSRHIVQLIAQCFLAVSPNLAPNAHTSDGRGWSNNEALSVLDRALLIE